MRYYDLIETPKTGKTFLEQNNDGRLIQQSDERVAIYFQPVDLESNERYFDEDGYPQIRERIIASPIAKDPTFIEIASLENSVTQRHLRGAALGDDYAINFIQCVEDKINELRCKL